MFGILFYLVTLHIVLYRDNGNVNCRFIKPEIVYRSTSGKI